ncbi:mannose/fructose/N-acetylgalactosamine-specific phosphotransferase system component IIC [Breznakia pachnodae]|uniref:Mannose/fructose/N-acetylgalactosamine-specific phosphotransferase system component IIC n=1 Tax=Breznakia pachnodae TaxID=265178 RepID=A0ABU0E0Z4_9FIRM|nr:mannose/fructose/N-acetylgalactosamine-specific phosphotransferase system component IIC [Breznakia pachnodae]
MFSVIQIILIALVAFFIQFEMNNSQQFIKCFGEKVCTGLMVGLIMGDYQMGLLVGGTFELMALGVSGFGGA